MIAMVGVLLSLCCFIGCPLLMGAMWLMARDREGPRLERELKRLNVQAERERARAASDAPGAIGAASSASAGVASTGGDPVRR